MVQTTALPSSWDVSGHLVCNTPNSLSLAPLFPPNPWGPDLSGYSADDSDVNGVATLLDMNWQAPPFADNCTAPSMALRFETLQGSGGGDVKVDFVYPTFDDANGTLHTSPVWRGSVP